MEGKRIGMETMKGRRLERYWSRHAQCYEGIARKTIRCGYRLLRPGIYECSKPCFECRGVVAPSRFL